MLDIVFQVTEMFLVSVLAKYNNPDLDILHVESNSHSRYFCISSVFQINSLKLMCKTIL